MTMRPFRSLVATVLVCLVAATGTLFAQGTDLGTIRGTVKDATGAVIPNAKIVITDLATKRTHDFVTNGDGDYEAFGLNAGNYEVAISAPGFGTEQIQGIALGASGVVSANATLRPSQTQQSVVVTAEAPLGQYGRPDHQPDAAARARSSIFPATAATSTIFSI